MTYNYGIFEGDGRFRVDPVAVGQLPGMSSIPVTRAGARAAISRLLNTQRSVHSGMGGTLWVVLYFCNLNKISHTVTIVPGLGSEVRIHLPVDTP